MGILCSTFANTYVSIIVKLKKKTINFKPIIPLKKVLKNNGIL